MTLKRVLISGGLAEGGVRTHVRLVTEVLRRAAAQVTICAAGTNWSPQQIAELEATGTRIVTSPFGMGPLAPLGKVQALVTWPFRLLPAYDVVYCLGHGRMHWYAKLFQKKAGKSVYHEVVMAPPDNHNAVGVGRRSDVIVANSEEVAKGWRKLAPRTSVDVIPFLTDPPRNEFRHQPREGDTLRAVYLGRLARHKGVQWLVESWPEIIKATGPARLDVYGGDAVGETLLEPLRQHVRSHGLESSICLHGPYDTDKLDDVLAKADVVLLPSQWEGVPLTLVEAVRRGIPIVATRVGGVPELEQENPDVELSDASHDAFFRALVTMAEKLRAGAINAPRLREWARARYDFDVVAKRWRTVLLDEGRRSVS